MTLRPDSLCGDRPELLHPAASFKLGCLASICLLRLGYNLHVSWGKSTSTVFSYRLAEEFFFRRVYSIHQLDLDVEKFCQEGGVLHG